MFQESGFHRHSQPEVEESAQEVGAALGVNAQVHVRRGMGIELRAKLRRHEFEGEAAERLEALRLSRQVLALPALEARHSVLEVWLHGVGSAVDHVDSEQRGIAPGSTWQVGVDHSGGHHLADGAHVAFGGVVHPLRVGTREALLDAFGGAELRHSHALVRRRCR